jgi:hypothetical protein
MPQQRVAAVHVLCVDGGHHEWGTPGTREVVQSGLVEVGLRRAAEAGRQCKRVGHRPGGLWVATHGGHGLDQAGRGAAREAALHQHHAPLHVLQRLAVALQRVVLEEAHAQVKGHRVKAARENDARTAGLCGWVVAPNHLRHPGRLAAQVDIVATGVDTGLQQRFAVQLVGAHGGDHGVGAGRQATQCGGVGRVGRQERHRTGCLDQIADLFQLGCAAAGQAPAHAAVLAVTLLQVLGHQPAGETAGAEHDEVELLFHAFRSRRMAVAPASAVR